MPRNECEHHFMKDFVNYIANIISGCMGYISEISIFLLVIVLLARLENIKQNFFIASRTVWRRKIVKCLGRIFCWLLAWTCEKYVAWLVPVNLNWPINLFHPQMEGLSCSDNKYTIGPLEITGYRQLIMYRIYLCGHRNWNQLDEL